MIDAKILLSNIKQIHTTEFGIIRIKNNLNLVIDNVVLWCINQIKHPDCKITKTGKNYYCEIHNCVITINAHSYTIITAHKIKGRR